MTGLLSLWLPILLSAVAVFVVSSVIHMLTGWHASDYPKLADQDKVMDTLRPLGIPPGDYMIPMPSNRQEMASPEFAEKMKKGPVVVMTVIPPGPVSMGRNLVQWFLYSLVVGLFAAYLASRALPVGAGFMPVLRFAGTTAFVGYALGLWQMSIWYHRSWTTTLKANVDGLIYGLLTGAILGWLWPR